MGARVLVEALGGKQHLDIKWLGMIASGSCLCIDADMQMLCTASPMHGAAEPQPLGQTTIIHRHGGSA